MRFKPVPPAPEGIEALARAHEAVPLVPGSETDCCARLVDRLDLRSRDVARTWLTFLRAIGLVDAGERGFVRRRVEADREALATGLREGVFGASELLEALEDADEPLTAAAAFDAIEGLVPRWERDRDPTWRATWEARIADLLEWLVLADLAGRQGEGFVRR